MRQELIEARALAIMECAAEKLTVSQIADRLGLNKATIYKYAKDFGISFGRDYTALIREQAEKGVTRHEAAQNLKLHYSRVCQIAREEGIAFSRVYHTSEETQSRIKSRADVMAALYREGYTLEQIGAQFGVTRERARQVMTKIHGVTGSDGGGFVKAARRAEKIKARKDATCMKKWGCTWQQWQDLKQIGRDMRSAGKGLFTTPTGAWRGQRNNAKRRGIEWELTLGQWWDIWQQSGHWDERGRGQGYVMCRHGDEGPYAVGNVFIDTAVNNSSVSPKKKKSGLPTGVSKIVRGNYVAFTAHRRIKGEDRYLGSHKTPELAHAAYLMAGAV